MMAAAKLTCGIFLLKLNSKARKGAILITIVSILSIPFYFIPFSKTLNSESFYARKRQVILEQMKPESQVRALENLEKQREIYHRKIIPILLIIVFGGYSLCSVCLIYYFTRPKVKEQFE